MIIFWQDTCVLLHLCDIDVQVNNMALFHQSDCNPKSFFLLISVCSSKQNTLDLICVTILWCAHRITGFFWSLTEQQLTCYLQPVYGGSGGADWHAVFSPSAGISIHIKESCLVPFLLGNCRSQSLLPDVNGNREKLFIDSEQKSPSGCFDFRETLPCKGSARLDCQCFGNFVQIVTPKVFWQ